MCQPVGVNRTETSLINLYERVWSCYNDDRTSTPWPTIPSSYYGGIGMVHKSHNAWVTTPQVVNYPEEHDYPQVTDVRPSNADAWLDFPNIDNPALIRNIGSRERDGDAGAREFGAGFYGWFLSHLPRYSGVYATFTPTPTLGPGVTPTATATGVRESEDASPFNNIWPYVMKPGCYRLTGYRYEEIP